MVESEIEVVPLERRQNDLTTFVLEIEAACSELDIELMPESQIEAEG